MNSHFNMETNGHNVVTPSSVPTVTLPPRFGNEECAFAVDRLLGFNRTVPGFCYYYFIIIMIIFFLFFIFFLLFLFFAFFIFCFFFLFFSFLFFLKINFFFFLFFFFFSSSAFFFPLHNSILDQTNLPDVQKVS